MASIEIDSNTIIKLLARRGSDLERKSIILSEGEFGYVVDTKRLYIGDGFTPGGIPTSIRFHNTTTNILGIGETVQINDLVYKSDTNEIYKLVSGTGTSLSDWQLISSPKYVYTDSATLSSTTAGVLFVREVSGQHISNNALGEGIEKVSDKISLSGSIAVNSVKLKSGNTLTLPNSITFENNFGTQQFIFPLNPGFDKYHLVTDGNGNLTWEPAAVVSAGTVFMADAAAPVGSVIFYAASSFIEPLGWLICDGRSVAGATYPQLSAAIGTLYGGDGTNFNLPNFMGGGMLYGVNRGVENIGSSYPVLTGITSSVFLTGTALTGLSATLSAAQTLFTNTPLEAYAGIWLIKHRIDNPITTQINVLTSGGLSAYNITGSQSTTAITLSGIYSINIPSGDIGTGNPAVVKAYRKARVPQMYTYDTPGVHSYTVSDNVYRIKVTATGPGGVGYIRYDSTRWRANGTQGGAGSTIVAYINVEPGEVYSVYVGRRGTAVMSPDPVTDTQGLTAGWGDNTSFSLSAGTVITDILSAGGAYDAVRVDGATPYNADWSGGGAARGGFKGGKTTTPIDAKVVSYYIIKGGDGGQFMENGPDGPGAASMWGSGPAPGGGGSGHARKDFIGQEIAQAGDGIVIVEEL
jgi:microcystin-dependent protein